MTRGDRAPAPNGQRNHGSGAHAGRVADRLLRLEHVAHDPGPGEQRHPRMVMAVVADEVAVLGDPPRERRLGPRPAALDEHAAGTPSSASTSSSRPSSPRSVGRSANSASIVSATRNGDGAGRLASLLHARDDDPADEHPLEDQEQDDRDHHRHQRARLDVGRVPVVDAVEPLEARRRAAGARASSTGRSAGRRSRSTSRRGGRSRPRR